jgi:hypothetical protein
LPDDRDDLARAARMNKDEPFTAGLKSCSTTPPTSQDATPASNIAPRVDFK